MTCAHAPAQRTRTSDTTYRCVCGARFERMKLAEYGRLQEMAIAADRWNKAMRTSTSARRFALTGEAEKSK